MTAVVDVFGGAVTIIVALLGLAGVYVTVALPLRRGQKDLASRVGIPNGNLDLAAIGDRLLRKQDVHDMRFDLLEAGFHDQKRTVDDYIVTDTAAHDELRELILEQNAEAARVKSDLAAQATKVSDAVAVAVGKIETAPIIPQQVDVHIHPEAE